MADWVLKRTAARVVVLDQYGHTLLLRAKDPADSSKGHWWEIPGGGIEHGARIFRQKTCHHKPEIIAGVEADACGKLLTDFFKAKRG